MRPEEVKRQIGLIQEGGWGGAFIHSRVGLTIPYLGEAWFAAADAAINECRTRGLGVWLYDEDKWPSGFSGGTVPLESKLFRQKALIARPANTPALANTQPVGAPQNGIQIYKWISPLGHPQFNGTSYVDTMDKRTVAKFIADAYEPYYTRYSPYYGGAIVAEFTDEPCAMFRRGAPQGAVALSENSFENFEALYGFDPVPHLSKLFCDEEGAEKFRLQWYCLNDKMFEENYVKQIADWCGKRGIGMTGHLMAEGSAFRRRFWGNAVMQCYRHMQIPGVDFLGRKNSEELTPKQCQSVVNQYGKPRMLTELYGVSGASLTFEDRRWIALQQITLGANLLNSHLALYTMAGCRKRDYPQNIFYQQSWWRLNSALDVPLARLCYALSRGQYKAEILLLHPEASFAALWKPRAPQSLGADDIAAYKTERDIADAKAAGKMLDIEKAFNGALTALIQSQICFDLGDETILKDIAKAQGAKLNVGKMTYSAVVIPAMETMSESTFALLKKFAQGGGKIIKLEGAPSKLNGEESAELKAFLSAYPPTPLNDLSKTLDALCPKTLAISAVKEGDAKDVWAHVRELEDGSVLVLLANQSRKNPFKAELLMSGDFNRMAALDFERGRIAARSIVKNKNGGGAFNAEIPQAAALLMLFDKREDAPVCVLQTSEARASKDVENISVRRLDDNSLTLDYASWAQSLNEADLPKGKVPVLEVQRYLNEAKYDGPLTLRYAFKTDGLDEARKLHLVIEHPERARIFVNGAEVKYAGLPFWRDINWLPIDISALVKDGENSVVLKYAKFEYGDLAALKPETRRYGTEIEAIYLVGDFSVRAEFTGEHPLSPMLKSGKLPAFKSSVFKAESATLVNPIALAVGDVSEQGLPQYAGRLEYSFNIAERIPLGLFKISLENLDASVAEVFVDGKSVEAIYSHPFKTQFIPQNNGRSPQIKIVIYANLYNLLGPSHRIEGDIINCGPDDFFARIEHKTPAELKAALDAWAQGLFTPNGWTNNCNVNSFGDIGKIRINSAEE